MIVYCFHQYCLRCISVLLKTLPSDEKSIRCVAKKCEALICKRRLEQFSMTPMVKQKEVRCKTCFEFVQLQFLTVSLRDTVISETEWHNKWPYCVPISSLPSL